MEDNYDKESNEEWKGGAWRLLPKGRLADLKYMEDNFIYAKDQKILINI